MQRNKLNAYLIAITIFLLSASILVGMFIPSSLFNLKFRPPENPSLTRTTLSFDDQGSQKDLAIGKKDAPLALIRLLGSFDFDLKKIKSRESLVPNLIFWRLPHDLQELSEVTIRKKLFIKILLPLIIDRNMQIQKKRQQIFNLKNIGIPNLRNNQKGWIFEQLKYYKVLSHYNAETTLNNEMFDELLLRANILPIPLAIAQAAIETGWGTSRFAIEGNALFGQWTWSGEGLKPKNAEEGKDHKVMKFHSLQLSVRAYLRNLNTHSTYRNLRKARTELRNKNKPLDSLILSKHLDKYAETGNQYIEVLQKIIEQNNLKDFDEARLLPSSKDLESLI